MVGCSDKEIALGFTVGCQPDIATTVSTYGTYTGCMVFNSFISVMIWDTWFGLKEAAQVHQCLVDLFGQIIIRKVDKDWVGMISLHKHEVKTKPGMHFGLDQGFSSSSKNGGVGAGLRQLGHVRDAKVGCNSIQFFY